jgi:MFS family permease
LLKSAFITSRGHQRNALRRCTYDGLAAMPAVFLLTPGNFVAAALLTGLYGLPPGSYGIIVSMPFWCNFIQLWLTPLLGKIRPQRLAFLSAGAQTILLAVLAAAMFWLPVNDPARSTPWLMAIFALLGFTVAFAGVGWTSWVQEWVPGRVRGKYFGIRNQVIQVATIVFLVSIGALLRRNDNSVFAFQCLLLATIALRALSTWYQAIMKTPRPSSQEDEARRPWREQIDALRRLPSFLWFVAFGAAWGFAANCIGPFYAVFMYQHLGLTVENVSWLTVLSSIGGVLSYPAWGALAHRFGNKPVIFFGMTTWQLQNYLWCFLTPANAWLVWGMWLFGGVMSAAVLLGMFNILLKLIPPTAKTAAISLNVAIASLVTAVAPMLGGRLLESLLATDYKAIDVYHYLFLLQPTLAILACLLLLSRVREPQSGELTTVFGAMRNVRTLGSIFGLTYVINFVFVKNPRDRA